MPAQDTPEPEAPDTAPEQAPDDDLLTDDIRAQEALAGLEALVAFTHNTHWQRLFAHIAEQIEQHKNDLLTCKAAALPGHQAAVSVCQELLAHVAEPVTKHNADRASLPLFAQPFLAHWDADEGLVTVSTVDDGPPIDAEPEPEPTPEPEPE